MIHGDFETRSRCNLLTEGAYNYARDESTEAMMFAFAIEDGPVEIWLPLPGNAWNWVRAQLRAKGVIVHKKFPQSVTDAIKEGKKIAAHNAQFERLIFWYVVCNDYKVPKPELEQFYCTCTQARANNLPAKLEFVPVALGLSEEAHKDRRGFQLIKMLCIPQEDGTFLEDPELLLEFAEYCIQDVVSERASSAAMRPLTEEEQEDYVVSEIINDTGLLVDLDFAEAAVEYAGDEQDELIHHIHNLTLGRVCKARGKKLTDWVYKQLTEEQRSHMHKYKDGERKLTLDKNARARIMADESVAATVAEVVRCSDFAQASSTAKFQAMLDRADLDDERVRGAYILFGASATKRYSSRGLQTHNMPRDKFKDPETVRAALMDGISRDEIKERFDVGVMQTLKRMIRHSVKAKKGHTFVCADWGQIEGRMLPRLALDNDYDYCRQTAQEKLDLYANQTYERDVYCAVASTVFGVDVWRDGSDKMEEMRQIGKVGELSLQYQGGEGAFNSMAANYGVHLPGEQVLGVKKGWRGGNPWAVHLWRDLENCAIAAVRNPGETVSCGNIRFEFDPNVLNGCLWVLLPSGTMLNYPGARAKVTDTKYGPKWTLTAQKAAWYPKEGETEWPRNSLYGGLLSENFNQSECGTLLREALLDLVLEKKAPVVGHTHDEILLEVPIAKEDYWRSQLEDSMLYVPEWCAGMPLDVDVWTGPNFKK